MELRTYVRIAATGEARGVSVGWQLPVAQDKDGQSKQVCSSHTVTVVRQIETNGTHE